MSWDDLSKNDMVWPSVREVNAYRRQVFQTVRDHILTHPGFDSLPITWVRRRPLLPRAVAGWAAWVGGQRASAAAWLRRFPAEPGLGVRCVRWLWARQVWS